MESDSIRKAVLSRRKTLDPQEVARRSGHLAKVFLTSLRAAGFEWKGRRIALYRAMAGEPDLQLLAWTLEREGAWLHFPRVVGDPKDGAMEMVHVPSQPGGWNHAGWWNRGAYGIAEPAAVLNPVDLADLEVILVPGVAFGAAGERIGMGAGFYDRLLPHAPQALKVSFCFDFQVYPRLDQSPWDQPVDWLIHDQGEFRSPRVESWLRSRSSAKADLS